MGAKLVINGVHVIPMEMANAFLIEGQDGLTLIDAAFPGKEAAVFGAIRGLGHSPDQLKHLDFHSRPLWNWPFPAVGFLQTINRSFQIAIQAADNVAVPTTVAVADAGHLQLGDLDRLKAQLLQRMPSIKTSAGRWLDFALLQPSFYIQF
jgi:hypothetical protein